jgi:proteasome accessory factor A
MGVPERKNRREFPPAKILCGIETEFGIIRRDVEESDPVVESMELIRSFRETSFGTWAYEEEDPRADARGGRVDRLAQDEEEEAFVRSDLKRGFSFRESKSDRILKNGARFYNDHTHPEYSTPECLSIRDLLLFDRAGTEILREAIRLRESVLGVSGALGLYRNNTDFHGHSYGCHENYLLPREMSFDEIVRGLTAFLVARIILTGAGKVGQEGDDGQRADGYQISQRADFMEVRTGVDTMQRRPLVNSRDEPHADKTRYRRLHLIVGDANMSEWQTAIKVGMTRLVLGALYLRPEPIVELEDPVRAIREISRAREGRIPLRCRNGRTMTASEILSLYREKVDPVLSGPEDRWIVDEWDKALGDYNADPRRLSDRVDWVAKSILLEWGGEEMGLSPGDPGFQSLDLAYHDIDPHDGLFWPLEEEGSIQRLTRPEEVSLARVSPPGRGRAPIRAAILARFGDRIQEAGWERIVFSGGRAVDLPPALEGDEQEVANLVKKIAALDDPSGLDAIVVAMEEKGEKNGSR